MLKEVSGLVRNGYAHLVSGKRSVNKNQTVATTCDEAPVQSSLARIE